ncbi:hypothetical protein ABTX34_16220 [Streptomyces sp. NPDC096538]
MKPHQGRLRRRFQMAGGLLRHMARRPVLLGWTVLLVVLSVLARHHLSQT